MLCEICSHCWPDIVLRSYDNINCRNIAWNIWQPEKLYDTI